MSGQPPPFWRRGNRAPECARSVLLTIGGAATSYAHPVAGCEHVEEIRADWPPVSDPGCEECAGDHSWVSLRRCLTCGHVGCCDSSPGLHATAHHRETGHPMVETLQPGQDWAWCYVDEVSVRHVDGGWVQVDLFFEAGVAYMRDHLDGGRRSERGRGVRLREGLPARAVGRRDAAA